MALRIEATPVGGGQGFVIADGENRRGPGGRMAVDVADGAIIVFDFDGVLQESRPIGGAEVQRFDRKLESGRVPCQVKYQFEDSESGEGAAFAFAAKLQASVPRLADITLTLAGQSVVLPNVWLRPLRARVCGVCVIVDYPLTFGLVAQPSQQ